MINENLVVVWVLLAIFLVFFCFYPFDEDGQKISILGILFRQVRRWVRRRKLLNLIQMIESSDENTKKNALAKFLSYTGDDFLALGNEISGVVDSVVNGKSQDFSNNLIEALLKVNLSTSDKFELITTCLVKLSATKGQLIKLCADNMSGHKHYTVQDAAVQYLASIDAKPPDYIVDTLENYLYGHGFFGGSNLVIILQVLEHFNDEKAVSLVKRLLHEPRIGGEPLRAIFKTMARMTRKQASEEFMNLLEDAKLIEGMSLVDIENILEMIDATKHQRLNTYQRMMAFTPRNILAGTPAEVGGHWEERIDMTFNTVDEIWVKEYEYDYVENPKYIELENKIRKLRKGEK